MGTRKAIYAGTFDPPTTGHLWMIEMGAILFDELVVAIGVNPEKRCMFSVEERLDMLQQSVKHLPNVKVSSFTNQFLIIHAQSINAQFILRGIRNGTDYEYERVMRHINSDFGEGIATVFLMPPRDIAEISSSMVKGLVGPEGWEKVVERYLSQPVFLKLKEVHDNKK